MKAMDRRSVGMILLLVCCGTFVGGCGRNLFSESSRDSSRRAKIDRYWGGDSAIDTTASRRRSGDMGFGYPAGMNPQ